jgi:pimeloyl-ACP methyl ester carboxylesterase
MFRNSCFTNGYLRGCEPASESAPAVMRARAHRARLEERDEERVLLGSSYGTVLATVTAGKATELGTPIPRAVVLTGTLGHAFAPWEEAAEYQAQWQSALARLPSDVVAALRAEQPPLGQSAFAWGAFIGDRLIGGFLPGIGSMLDASLAALRDDASAEDKENLRLWVSRTDPTTHPSPQPTPLFRQVACPEISETNAREFELMAGELVPRFDQCEGIDLVEPYDAGHWPITAPIFYIQGDRDPATSLAQAQYHAASQPQTTRFFIRVADAGHARRSERRGLLRIAVGPACGRGHWSRRGTSDLRVAARADRIRRGVSGVKLTLMSEGSERLLRQSRCLGSRAPQAREPTSKRPMPRKPQSTERGCRRSRSP